MARVAYERRVTIDLTDEELRMLVWCLEDSGPNYFLAAEADDLLMRLRKVRGNLLKQAPIRVEYE